MIEHDIISAREYKEGKYERNGYFTIGLFSSIYAGLSSKEGTPGDLMGRRMAFELLAAKGYKDGMVPYISNQYEKEAKDRGSVFTSYGKQVGLVTDKLVLEKVFDNKYKSWVEFKKAMYNERKSKFDKLTNISFANPNASWQRPETVTVTGIQKLQSLMKDAVNADANDELVKLYPETSRVHKLKKVIFKAYLDQTKDFRTSIFESKK